MKIERITEEPIKKSHPPYWEDICPICKTKAITGCRCIINDRKCANNHTWHWKDGKVVIGSGHNK
jgi:hypothetical protein